MASISNTALSKHEISGVLIEHTAKRMKQAFAKMLSDIHNGKITVDQWVVLYQLYKYGCLSQLEIGQYAFKDSPTVTKIIDILESKKYILKSIHENDRRKFDISLSSEGLKLIGEILPTLSKFRSLSYANIPENELTQLEYILNKINFNLQ